MKLFALFVFIFILVTGCAVGQDYKPLSTKQAGMPLKWHAKLPHSGNNLQLVNWWGQFNDPILVYFIESAIATNPTLAQSVAKISQAQANLRIAQSSFFPNITANALASAAQNSFSTMNTSGAAMAGGSPIGDSSDFITAATGGTSAYSAGLNASWEIDLFGAIRRNVEVYQARLDASNADWNDARISLAAQVADTYVSLRKCQLLVDIYESQYAARTSTQNLTELKAKVGFAPIADEKQGAGLVAQTLSNIENQHGNCEQYKNQLVALTSLSHQVIESMLIQNFAQIPVPKVVTISAVPADLLSQRPDVSSAERSVAAALANADAAIAKRYPSVSLTGSVAANGGTLYAGQPTSWSFGPSVTLPITDGGQLRARVTLAWAQYDEAVAKYKSTVLTAVKDVENALVRIDAANKREAAALSAVDNYEKYFNAMNKKYQIGWISLLDLETVRINLVNYQTNLAEAKLEQSQAWIALYKAVGGEWNKPAVIAKTQESQV